MTERQPGSDPIGELQRWLIRSGARSVTRQVGDQVRTVLGGSSSTHGDVWENATADYESPECQWCPICRARRRLRESGPGLSSTVAAAGDAVSVVLQDAAVAFEAAVAAAGRQARPRDDAPANGTVWDEATDEPARPRPRVLPDPPAWPAEPAEPSLAAEAPAEAAEPLAEPAAETEPPAETEPLTGAELPAEAEPPAGTAGPSAGPPEAGPGAATPPDPSEQPPA